MCIPPATAESEATYLIGAPVFAKEGTEVGTVSGYRGGDADDEISELYVTSAQPVGVEKATIVLPRASVMLLRGAVLLDLELDEVIALFEAVGATFYASV